MAKTLILDGNSLLFRCFYATFRPDQPVMTNKEGTPTNAIFGFANMVVNIRQRLTPADRMIVCFDTGHPTLRSQEIAGYKAQRKPIDPNLKIQIPLAHRLLDVLGIDHAEMEGYEGDDVAGSLARYATKQGDQVTLFTSDKDFLQLIDENTQVCALRKGLTDTLLYTRDNIVELYGCRADQVVDFKALAGDSSDNYKGIPHVGAKTALKLLETYDHLEDILKAYENDDQTSLGRNLKAGAEAGRLCLKIARINIDLNVGEIYDRGRPETIDEQEFVAFCQKYELHRLAKALTPADFKGPGAAPIKIVESTATFSYVTIDDIDADPLTVSAVLAGKNENTDEIKGFALGYADKYVFLPAENLKEAPKFKAWLAANKRKNSLDSKTLVVAASRLGLTIEGLTYDYLLVSYILDSDHAVDIEHALLAQGQTLSEELIVKYLQATAWLQQSQEEMLNRLTQTATGKLFTEVELPLAHALADMEIEGMPLDLKTLADLGAHYGQEFEAITQKIYDYAGTTFNIKSPRQIADLLFKQLGLTPGAKEIGTSIEVLLNHYDEHPIIPLIIQHRTYSKIISAYLESLPKHVQTDGKIHAMINQTLTTTGRLSMAEPNLQNISIRKEEGKEIRKAFFYADPDYEFLSLDYSQIELRLLAALGHIESLIEVCNSGADIHQATAAKVFNVPLAKVTEEMRRKAKTINFGIVYGISAYGLSQRLRLSVSEAKKTIDLFMQNFGGIKEYEKSQIEFAREHGYVKTILNRQRHFPDINSSDHFKRTFSERAAVNATIQGSAADLIKVAMNKVAALLAGKKTKMILQIHDELVFKAYKPEEKELVPLLTETMETALPLPVKITVAGALGHSWFDCK